MVDEWSWHQALARLLHWLPVIVAFVVSTLWSLLLVRLAKRKAKKEWDADFLKRYKEEARSEIEERTAQIKTLETELAEERESRQELAARNRAAVIMAGRITEILATTDPSTVSVPMRRRAQ